MRKHREPIQRLWEYWRRLRSQEGGVPARRQFDPLEITQALPWMAMLDLRQPERVICSLWGTMLGAAFDRDWTGDDLAQTLPVLGKADTIDNLLQIRETGRPRLYRDRSINDNGTVVRYDKIYLPLATDGRISHIVAAFNLRYSSVLISFNARQGAEKRQPRGGDGAVYRSMPELLLMGVGGPRPTTA